MDLALFIARRIAFQAQQSFSRFIIRLATVATAVSVAAMIITLGFVNGFQSTVSQKVFSFWGHVRLQQYEPSKALVAEESPLERNDSAIAIVKQIPGVETVQSFATKSAVLQHKTNIEGILFKGVQKEYNFKNLKGFLKAGSWPDFSDTLYSRDIILSQPIAEQMELKVNDSVKIYFIDPGGGRSNFRRMRISGIFKTGIEEYDKLFAIGDERLIQRLNNWTENQVGGYEIFLSNYKMMDSVSQLINEHDALPGDWISRTVKEVYPNIFDWLGIQDVNRDVIFIVMAIVAIINLVTCLLILVLERTKMVGILKAVGANNFTIQTIFLLHATYITIIGVGLGLLIGLGLALLQQYTGFIKLDEAAYYVSAAPVKIIWWEVVLVCVGTVVVCFVSLIVPTLLVRNIQPVKAIQFR